MTPTENYLLLSQNQFQYALEQLLLGKVPPAEAKKTLALLIFDLFQNAEVAVVDRLPLLSRKIVHQILSATDPAEHYMADTLAAVLIDAITGGKS